MKKLIALLAAIAMVVTIFPALAETAAIGTPDAPVVVRYLCKDVDPADEDVQKMAEIIEEKMAANDDPHFQARATVIKEQRAELAKHHVSVLLSTDLKRLTKSR